MSAVLRPGCALAALLALTCIHGGRAVAAETDAGSLADLSLEELSNVQITSVSKRAERLSDAAASVFVITADDIRRSGVRRLPDALRLAPNLQVAQISASAYAISARGLNGAGSGSNKLLVLIDGRSVYTPLFAGVFWDAQDVMLEDVERIEVISGPGGTLWGINAVNGVINIITRSAAKTQGGLVEAGIGNRDAGGGLRYGGPLGSDGHYRVYAMGFNQKHTENDAGATINDAWNKTQAGFRIDWSRASDSISANGNVYRGYEGQPLPGSVSVTGVPIVLGNESISGANLTGLWHRALEGGASLSVQGYYDRTERDAPPSVSETLDILDLELQHSLRPIGIHSLVWGGEFRYAMDRVQNATVLVTSVEGLAVGPPRPYFGFLPADVNQKWPSLFAQDEMAVLRDLHLTVGARLERNDYTGTEFLPSARLAWKWLPEQLLWGAASRAVRAPSRYDRDTYVPGAPPFLLAGGPDVRSEVANVYELGYRGQPLGSFSYSVTLFHTDYDHLRTQEIGFGAGGPFIFFSNQMRGNSNGVETWGTYQASETWRLSAGLNALRERLTLRPGSVDEAEPVAQQGADPTHSWTLRSSFDLPYRVELDAMLRRISGLSHPTPPFYSVPAYTGFDLRAGWKPRGDLELSITGRNLLSGGHGELLDPATRSRFGQDVFFKVAWRT